MGVVWVLEINISGFYFASCQHSIAADIDVKGEKTQLRNFTGSVGKANKWNLMGVS